jgi:hypothetical protein
VSAGFRRPSRRRALVFAFLIVVGAVALGLAAGGGDDGGDDPDERAATTTSVAVASLDRRASEEVDAVRFAVVEEPERYRITYRVAERGGDVTTEEITVVRPFVSETVIRREGEVIGVQRSAFGRILSSDGRGDDTAHAVGPAIAGADLRFAAVLDDAVARDRLEAREQRRVAGRRCQVYRAGTSLLGGSLPVPGDPAVEHADACIDESGLLLEEWWVVDGDAIRHRVAVDVDTEHEPPPAFGAGWSDVPPSLPLDRGGGSILRLRAGSAPPGSFFDATGAAPAGFVHRGRYTVIPPQATAFSDESERGSIVASTADVWTRGADLLVVDQGGTLEQRRVYEVDPENELVPIEGLGDAEIRLGLAGNEIRVLRPAGRFVRVVGTLPVDDLISVARSLVEGVGNELVVDEGAPLLG